MFANQLIANVHSDAKDFVLAEEISIFVVTHKT